MWALGVCWVLLGILGTGSSQLQFVPGEPLIVNPCNESVTLPCIITNLQLNTIKAMFVKWNFEGKQFFSFDGYDSTIRRNNTFQSANLLNAEKLPQGVASLTLSRSEAVEGNYTCRVVETNREGDHNVELKHAGGPCGAADGVGPSESADGVVPNSVWVIHRPGIILLLLSLMYDMLCWPMF